MNVAVRTVSNFRLQIQLALVPRRVHVRPRLTRAPRHRRTANAFAGGRRISAFGRLGGPLADEVAARARHHRPVWAVPPPSARDLWKTKRRDDTRVTFEATPLLRRIRDGSRLFAKFLSAQRALVV